MSHRSGFMNALDVERTGTPSILIVDDTPANVGVLADYLCGRGFAVMVAQDGEEGIERARYGKPDLILLDVMMPGVDGFEACRRLKAGDDTRAIPVIFMTALSDTADKITGFEVGGVDYVTKPFQVEEVLARVNTQLSLQAARQQLAEQNRQLQQEIAIRLQVENALQRAQDELEERVAQRTDELARANAELQTENLERQRAEARMRRLVESNIIGVFFWDLGGGVSEANEAFLRIVGYARQDLLAGAIRWTDITPIEHHATIEHALAEIREMGTCTPYEKEFIRKDGSRIPVLVGLALFEGSAEHGVGFVLDLSERKRAETEHRARLAAEAANRAKSEFLANMSHELRSPLNAILGFTRLLTREPDLPDVLREDLDLILKSGEHLHQLINDVLDLSKVEAGRATLNEADFDLDFLLDELKDMLTPAAVDKGLQLVFAPHPQVPRHVRTDPLKLRQVLINLISNAIKFTRRGQITVRMEAHPSTAGNDACRLDFSVTDTGIGIAADDLARLCSPFEQTEAGRQTQEGTGLGLAITRAFIGLMGGEMHIGSEVGRGTDVHFDIQARTVAGEPAPAPAVRNVVGVQPGQAHFRILVVDDQAAGRLLIQRLLSPLGFEVREAGNGEEAVEVWRQWQPDLIWMDMRMPVLDGREATRRIRAASPSSNRPTIIALTASSFEEERADVLAAGCDDYLRKPFREHELITLLEKHLGVRFIYQEDVNQTHPPIDPQAVAALPEALRAPLTQALICLDTAAIDQAIAAIQEQDAQLSATLMAWAKDFEYERILALLKPPDGGSEIATGKVAP